MDSARPSSPKVLYTLSEAAQYLAVSVDVLIAWNEHDILKPTINSSGEIVYSKEQIDKFKLIQNNRKIISLETVNNNHSPITNSAIEKNSKSYDDISNQNLHQNNYSQINNYNFYNQSPSSSKNENDKHSISLKGILATFGFFAVAVMIVAFTQQSNLDSIITQNSEEDFGYDSHNATIETTNAKDLGIEYSKLKDVGNDIPHSSSSNLNKAFENEKKNDDKENKDELSLLNIVVGNDIVKSSLDKNNDIITYGQKANLRTGTKSSGDLQINDAVNEVFDTEGNIRVSNEDPTEKELLATAFGTNGYTQSQDVVRKNSNIAGVVTFMILGLLFIYFLHSSRRQLLSTSAINSNNLALQPISFNTQNDIEWEKILEIDQKTDGSVVIIFHGKEYKVSKPELDSESDKFIERLMQLTNIDSREIEYDLLDDPYLELNTPLSKLVTRLGFVGVKRDLFFPRTSKSRVLFRKNLTLDDLFSMNLTIEQLSEDFDLVN